jgi:hypothetical protein
MHLPFSILFAGSLLLSSAAAAADMNRLAVIVPHSQATRSFNGAELSLIYWRKKLYWAEGQRMQPVNFPTENPLRRQFSQVVLGGFPETQTEYWNVMYYHGISPPHVVASQEAMLRFVAETPGAIGYVDACKVDNRVKVLLWIGADGISATAPVKLECAE